MDGKVRMLGMKKTGEVLLIDSQRVIIPRTESD